MSEKVRYYLEQSVPELEDLQKKGLFDKNEITMIMRRRTDFEHRITGRGSKPRDFLKYSEFEKNLEKLRKKRYNRLSKAGVVNTKPSISDWAGTRRILFIYERATRRYPKELPLWHGLLKFAKKQGAIKVVYKTYTRLIQLQPRNIDVWISAANYEFEDHGNAKGARVLLQKALRFNGEDLELWLNYFKFELSYISRLLARRKILGLVTAKQQLEYQDKEPAKKDTQNTDINDDDMAADEIVLPETEDLKQELHKLPEADIDVLGNPETNPALRGDVALMVYDIALDTLLKEPSAQTVESILNIATKFLGVISHFDELDRFYLSSHIVNKLLQQHPDNLQVIMMDITLTLRFTSIKDVEFVDKLKMSVNKFMAYKLKLKSLNKQELVATYVAELNRFSGSSESIDTILASIISRCET